MGARFFTGLYNIEVSRVSCFTKGKFLFNLSKTINTTLKIRPIFTNPKTAPKTLFIIPKAAASANFVNNLPESEINKTIITKVLAKAII